VSFHSKLNTQNSKLEIRMSYENILYECDGALATITVNRPKVLNALSQATIAELGAALRAAEADETVRVVIITGAGTKAFVAGADIAELRALAGADAARWPSTAIRLGCTSPRCARL
jgi:enoyl-CoA hydratase